MPSKDAKQRKSEKKQTAEANKRHKKDLRRQRQEIKAQNMARGKHLDAINEFLNKAKTIENDPLQAALGELSKTIETIGEIPAITSTQSAVRGRFR